MPRLSCVIPVVGSTQDLETTLVSVLEKRPANCEIIVVLGRPYDDPYGLADEVRFVEAIGSGLLACVNLGIRASRGEIVHVLAAGIEASDDWTEAALRHFDDPEVAAVAPVIRRTARPEQVLAAGVAYDRGGRRKVCKAFARQSAPTGRARQHHDISSAIGPTIDAGFYRKTDLAALGGGFSPKVGDELADVDLALVMQQAARKTVVEPRCPLFAERLVAAKPRGFDAGLFGERLFLRNLPVSGWLPAFLLHPLVVIGELVRAVPRGATIANLAGRITAWFRMGDYRRHHQFLKAARELAQRQAAGAAVVTRTPTRGPVTVAFPNGARRAG